MILDSTLGVYRQISAIDPAVDGDKRILSLDMFAAAKGHYPAARSWGFGLQG
ncbi:MAG: hypothetical protein ABSE51_13285 [Terracidiphilus sp.]